MTRQRKPTEQANASTKITGRGTGTVQLFVEGKATPAAPFDLVFRAPVIDRYAKTGTYQIDAVIQSIQMDRKLITTETDLLRRWRIRVNNFAGIASSNGRRALDRSEAVAEAKEMRADLEELQGFIKRIVTRGPVKISKARKQRMREQAGVMISMSKIIKALAATLPEIEAMIGELSLAEPVQNQGDILSKKFIGLMAIEWEKCFGSPPPKYTTGRFVELCVAGWIDANLGPYGRKNSTDFEDTFVVWMGGRVKQVLSLGDKSP